jgi:hypothetical protein
VDATVTEAEEPDKATWVLYMLKSRAVLQPDWFESSEDTLPRLQQMGLIREVRGRYRISRVGRRWLRSQHEQKRRKCMLCHRVFSNLEDFALHYDAMPTRYYGLECDLGRRERERKEREAGYPGLIDAFRDHPRPAPPPRIVWDQGLDPYASHPPHCQCPVHVDPHAIRRLKDDGRLP